MVNLQNKEIIVGAPVEIEDATNKIRLMLSEISWLTHPFHVAQRFVRRDDNKKGFYYPETYLGRKNGKFKYHRLTPDNDYNGMCFFIIGDEENDYNNYQQNFLTYNVGIVFSVNLDLINKTKLDFGLFTQELINEVRRKLTVGASNFLFQYSIKKVTRDLKNCYREFILDDIEQYNRAPMQCFRFDLTLTIQEGCDTLTQN